MLLSRDAKGATRAPAKSASRLAVSDRECCLTKAIHVYHVTDHRSACLFVQIQAGDFQGVDRKDVVVDRAGGRRGASVAGFSKISARLQRSRRQILSATGARGQFLR